MAPKQGKVGVKVEITGLRRTVRELRELDDGIGAEIKILGRKAAEVVAGDARRRAPKGDTGKLERSIRVGVTFTAASVKAGGKAVPYAAPIHWGWARHNISPQLFMYEALDARREEVFAMYDKGITEMVERVIHGGAD